MKKEINEMADYIFDNPEMGLQEYKASKLVIDYLEKENFEVNRGIAGMDTAFQAVYEYGTGGVSIGLLCEYDALAVVGHACSHHIQAPIMLGVAKALKDNLRDINYKIVVYGTPAEDSYGGKIDMLRDGYFKDIDVALMVHGWDTTVVDYSSLAYSSFEVRFHGKKAHASASPETGISAFDALLLTFQGVEFMREHVKEDVRIHYTVLDAGGPSNVVPEKAVGQFTIRSESRPYLDTLILRFKEIVRGASIMTGTTYEITLQNAMNNKIPSHILNKLIMKNAIELRAPRPRDPIAVKGSSDFANVMYELPGVCLRIAFVNEGIVAHSQGFYDAGKTENTHLIEVLAAKILVSVSYDLISNPEKVQEIKEEHKANKLRYLNKK
jgi:aminobenzoyl-glutamate utilization protein B